MRKFDFAVTITGCAGFVGSHLAREFLEGPYDVRVFGTDRPGADTNRIDDLADCEDFTYEEYDARQPIHSDMLAVDTFYHFAGIADPKQYLENPLTVMDLNLDGLRNVLERIVRWTSHRPRVVYSSTSEVYGRNLSVPFDEDTSDTVFGRKRRWCYAATKLVGEHYLQAYADLGVRHTIFRLFNVVGLDIDQLGAGRVITSMLGSALDRGYIEVVAPGTQTRCFTWIDDATELFMRTTYYKKRDICGEHEGTFRASGDYVVNCGSEEEVTMTNLAKLIAVELSHRHGIERPRLVSVEQPDGYSDGYEDVPRRVPSTTKAKNVFGWRAVHGLDDMVASIVAAALEREKVIE